MPTAQLRAVAVIEGQDKSSAAFRSAAATLKKFEGQAKQVSTAMRGLDTLARTSHVSSAMARAAEAMDATQRASAGAIKSFREQHAALAAARQQFRSAQSEVERLGRAMREAGPTREMTRQYETAQRQVKAAASAFEKKRLAVSQAREEMGRYGVTLQNINQQERSLARALQRRSMRDAGGMSPPTPAVSPGKPVAGSGAENGRRDLDALSAVPLIDQARRAVVAGADVDSERSRMRQAGWTDADIKTTEHRANRFAAEYGLAPGAAMGIIREARPIFGGDMKQTLDSVPDFFKVRAALQQGRPSGSSETLDRDMGRIIKAAEIGGYSKDPERLRAFADFMTQMAQVNGNVLRGEEIENFFKSGKTAASAADFEFLKAVLPTFLPEQGGDRVGTALMTLRQALVGGKMKKRTAENLADLGVVDKAGLIATKDEDVQGVKQGALKGQKLAETNPLEWIKQVLLPAMDAKGIKPEDRDATVSSLFSDRNAEYIVSQMMNNIARLEKDRATVEQAKGLSGVAEALKDDPKLVAARVKAATENAGAAVADPVMDALKTLGERAADSINHRAEAARDNPTASTIALTGGALAGGAAAGYLGSGMGWLARGALIAGGAAGGGMTAALSVPAMVAEMLNSDPHLKARSEQHIKVGPELLERASKRQRFVESNPEGARGEAMRKIHGLDAAMDGTQTKVSEIVSEMQKIGPAGEDAGRQAGSAASAFRSQWMSAIADVKAELATIKLPNGGRGFGAGGGFNTGSSSGGTD
jgi:hypothetical protein